MEDVQQRFTAIRHEIDSLKAALQTTEDDIELHRIHARINNCIRESLQIIDQHLGRRSAAANARAAPADHNSSERSVGG